MVVVGSDPLIEIIDAQLTLRAFLQAIGLLADEDDRSDVDWPTSEKADRAPAARQTVRSERFRLGMSLELGQNTGERVDLWPCQAAQPIDVARHWDRRSDTLKAVSVFQYLVADYGCAEFIT